MSNNTLQFKFYYIQTKFLFSIKRTYNIFRLNFEIFSLNKDGFELKEMQLLTINYIDSYVIYTQQVYNNNVYEKYYANIVKYINRNIKH